MGEGKGKGEPGAAAQSSNVVCWDVLMQLMLLATLSWNLTVVQHTSGESTA